MNGRSDDEPMSGASSDAGPVVITIAVGSTNPAKINSVRVALNRVIQDSQSSHSLGEDVILEVEGFDVDSGVPHQPMGDEETQLGAKNRALAAYQDYRKKFLKFPHLAVGLEGGLEWCSQEKKVLWCMAWMCCYGRRKAPLVDLLASGDATHYFGDKKPVFGFAKTASFAVPPPVTELINQGMELGDADDKVFNRVNSKQRSGTVGVLSGGIIDRSAYYEHALVLGERTLFTQQIEQNLLLVLLKSKANLFCSSVVL
jgi:non-canonical (house-cleaning) NTP pyrophosphatase